MENRSCKLCNKPILLLPSSASRQIVCLDRDPAENGSYAILDGLARLRTDSLFDQILDAPFYTQHLETCEKRPVSPNVAAKSKKA